MNISCVLMSEYWTHPLHLHQFDANCGKIQNVSDP